MVFFFALASVALLVARAVQAVPQHGHRSRFSMSQRGRCTHLRCIERIGIRESFKAVREPESDATERVAPCICRVGDDGVRRSRALRSQGRMKARPDAAARAFLASGRCQTLNRMSTISSS